MLSTVAESTFIGSVNPNPQALISGITVISNAPSVNSDTSIDLLKTAVNDSSASTVVPRRRLPCVRSAGRCRAPARSRPPRAGPRSHAPRRSSRSPRSAAARGAAAPAARPGSRGPRSAAAATSRTRSRPPWDPLPAGSRLRRLPACRRRSLPRSRAPPGWARGRSATRFGSGRPRRSSRPDARRDRARALRTFASSAASSDESRTVENVLRMSLKTARSPKANTPATATVTSPRATSQRDRRENRRLSGFMSDLLPYSAAGTARLTTAPAA